MPFSPKKTGIHQSQARALLRSKTKNPQRFTLAKVESSLVGTPVSWIIDMFLGEGPRLLFILGFLLSLFWYWPMLRRVFTDHSSDLIGFGSPISTLSSADTRPGAQYFMLVKLDPETPERIRKRNSIVCVMIIALVLFARKKAISVPLKRGRTVFKSECFRNAGALIESRHY